MKQPKMGENISHEWDECPCAKDLWRALQLIKEDNTAGVYELNKISARGSALSMMYLGHGFFIGRYGLEKNPSLGEKWLRSSAEHGSIEAIYVLAKNFEATGKGTEAVATFKQAAELGYSPAMFVLGLRYYFGQDVDHDLARAHQYFKKAADAGHLYGVLWEAHTRRKLRNSAITSIRYLWVRVSIVFRLIYALVTYPSSDRLRK